MGENKYGINSGHLSIFTPMKHLTLIPLGYFEHLSPLGGGGGGAVFAPPPRSRQLMDRLTRKLAQS